MINAFLAGEVSSAAAMLAPAATFHSPIRDYRGAEQIGAVWRAVAGVVKDARPTSVHERDGETIAFFAGAIKDNPVDGVLRTLTDENDRVADVTLMIRPWTALKAGLADITS
jgi:hypothetical protein